MKTIASAKVLAYDVFMEADECRFDAAVAVEESEALLSHVKLSLRSSVPVRPGPLRMVWHHPLAGTHLKWFPGCGADRTILPEWRSARICRSCNTSNAPVYALLDSAGVNALTFAVSDVTNAVTLAAGVVEETATVKCEVTLFPDPCPPMRDYEITLRLDARPLSYYRALAEVSDWWAGLPGAAPARVPEHARLPMYSSWYSFHQNLSPEGLEKQCRLAKSLGMESVIVDDGWQTDDNSRGYAFCGDWEVAPSKFTDFAAHVRRVHDIGMKYILWFSVPFVGVHSKAYKRFKDKVLNPATTDAWFVLDPRFPDVREYLINLYESFITRFGIDGFKLDFVDTFELSPETRDTAGGGRDIDSVPEAVDRLLTDVMTRLRAMNPEVLVEFRQSYVGPLMRKYGNMFRSGDVPGDYHGNRRNTLDIRLISGNTPAHSDMVMWGPDDCAEGAAMQLIHTLFAVPQVSVLLDRIPPAQVEMIRRYLSFWREHRDVLLDGELAPLEPGSLYAAVVARNEHKLIAVAYADTVVPIGAPAPERLIVVNGTLSGRVVLDVAKSAGRRKVVARSCTGDIVREEAGRFGAGLHALRIPPGGAVEITP